MRIKYLFVFNGFLLLAVFLLSIVSLKTALAEEIDFEVSIDRDIISLGQSVQLSLKFEGSSDIPRPKLPNIDGIQSRYIGPSTMVSIINGRMSSSIVHIYSIIPLKTGRFKIGPFSFEYNTDTYTSDAVTIEVVEPSADSGRHAQSQPGMEMDIRDRIFVVMESEKDSVYINEIIPLTIKLYINNLTIRDIQYPEFNHEGFSIGEFDEPRQYKERKDGIIYNVIEFRTQMFGTKTGRFRLGPARLKGNLVIKRRRRRRLSPFDDLFGNDLFEDFLGGYERSPIESVSDELALEVLPLPDKGRPADFTGAVGNFGLNVKASPAQITVGDPVTLTMIVSGEGNLNTVTSPMLKQQEGFKVYEPQIRQEGNKKSFEQILIPLTDTIKETPAVTFSFFDPEKGRYQVISKEGIPLMVAKPEKEEEITITEAPQGVNNLLKKERFGRDIIYIKESTGKLKRKGNYLYKNKIFLLLHIVPLFLLVTLFMLKKRQDKLKADIGYARRLSAPKKAKKGIKEAEQHLRQNNTQEFYASVFKTLREYIGDRFHLPPGGITADIFDNTLRYEDISEGMRNRLKEIFKECDTVRYASSHPGTKEMEATLEKLKEVIDYIEHQRS